MTTAAAPVPLELGAPWRTAGRLPRLHSRPRDLLCLAAAVDAVERWSKQAASSTSSPADLLDVVRSPRATVSPPPTTTTTTGLAASAGGLHHQREDDHRPAPRLLASTLASSSSSSSSGTTPAPPTTDAPIMPRRTTTTTTPAEPLATLPRTARIGGPPGGLDATPDSALPHNTAPPVPPTEQRPTVVVVDDDDDDDEQGPHALARTFSSASTDPPSTPPHESSWVASPVCGPHQHKHVPPSVLKAALAAITTPRYAPPATAWTGLSARHHHHHHGTTTNLAAAAAAPWACNASDGGSSSSSSSTTSTASSPSAASRAYHAGVFARDHAVPDVRATASSARFAPAVDDRHGLLVAPPRGASVSSSWEGSPHRRAPAMPAVAYATSAGLLMTTAGLEDGGDLVVTRDGASKSLDDAKLEAARKRARERKRKQRANPAYRLRENELRRKNARRASQSD